MAHQDTPALDQRRRCTQAAMRIMTGAAGGLPEREVDTAPTSAYVAVYAASINFHAQHHAHQQEG
jgi:hypothetical protein